MPTQSNDVIRGPYLNRVIDALGGNDSIYWGPSDGRTTIYGGDLGENYDPNPYNTGNPGGDRLYINGNVGAKIWFNSTEKGVVTVGTTQMQFNGIERVHGTGGNDTINAGSAALAPAHGSTPTHGVSIYSGAGHDSILGSQYDDVIDGGSGNDTIRAGGGDDFIQSSTGDDLIYGGAGNENIRWGLGDNVAAGNDTIYGGDGQDLINIWSVNRDQRTGAYVEFTHAGNGRAVSTMGGVTNELRFFSFEQGWTHRGNDTIDASRAHIPVASMKGINFNARWGDDVLIGSRGNDTLEGGEGRDTITGGAGNDLISLNGEFYNARAQGDGHVDTLIFRPGHGADTVLAFDTGLDILDVGGRDYIATETARGTFLDFGNGDSILLSYITDFI